VNCTMAIQNDGKIVVGGAPHKVMASPS
jgi:hypothetical protein